MNPTQLKYGVEATGTPKQPRKPTVIQPNPRTPTPHVPGKVIATLPEPCDPQRNILAAGPDVSFVTVTVPIGNAQADVPVVVPRASKFMFIASLSPIAMNDSLFLHFLPLRNVYTSGSINPQGTENWIPLCPGNAATTAMGKLGLWVRMNVPFPQTIYFDLGTEHGASVYSITFGFTNNIEQLGQLMNNSA
jgi:hypothetical protein